MTILGIIGLIVGIIGFFAFDLPSHLSDWYYAVYLTPKTIFVEKGDWSTTKSVQIVNNKPYPIYSIQLEVSEANTGTNIDNIDIKPQPHIVSTNFSTSTDMNAFVISGYSKLDNRKWKRSIIYQIDAHSSFSINLTVPASSVAEKFNLRITDFSKDSNAILQQNAATFVNFQIKK